MAVALDCVPTMVAHARRHPDRVPLMLMLMDMLSFVSFLLSAGLVGRTITGRAREGAAVHGRSPTTSAAPATARWSPSGLATTACALTKP
ncbi:MAG: hypothetical protein RQ833_02740 [Sphingomonadaceae bacterium]|nr:hypothetical protein [Sphingomonadaceae bacterium]